MRLVARFRCTTPVFCGGARKNEEAEIRPFAIRGMVRWFWRALDGRPGIEREGRIFGCTAGEEGQASPVVLRVEPMVRGSEDLSNLLKPGSRDTVRGEQYLGYSLYLGQSRKAVPAGTEFRVILEPRWEDPTRWVRRQWAASLWMLGHLGGIGSRMRRGFGTIALQEWEDEGWTEDAPNDPEGRFPNRATTVPEWRERFLKGYDLACRWIRETSDGGGVVLRPPDGRGASSDPPRAGSRTPDQEVPHLPASSANLQWAIGPGCPGWLEALRDIGKEMMQFRDTKGPDKYRRNASFGLPLTTSNRDVLQVRAGGGGGGRRSIDRSPSRFWIRVIRIGDRFHPMVWVCEGPLLPPGGSMIWKRSTRQETPLPELGTIPEFLKELRRKGWS